MLLNCGVGEDSWESLGLQGDPTSHSKENQSWVFIGRTDEAETAILGPPDTKSWHIWETLLLGKIEGRRRMGQQKDGWMASPTQWTGVWVNSRSWWWIGRPGMLQSMGSQRVRHNWATEVNWIPNSQAFRLSLNYITGFLDSIASRQQIEEFLNFHNHMNKFLE